MFTRRIDPTTGGICIASIKNQFCKNLRHFIEIPSMPNIQRQEKAEAKVQVTQQIETKPEPKIKVEKKKKQKPAQQPAEQEPKIEKKVEQQPEVDLVNEDPATHLKVLELFKQYSTPHELLTHAPVLTSEEAANVRKFPLKAGAKAILVHSTLKKKEFEFKFFVMSGEKKICWPKVKKFLGNRNIRFAKLPEVKEITGCLTGAVPPFGSQFKGNLTTYVDPSLRLQGDVITFNVGLRTHSIIMKYKDWMECEKPEEVDFIDNEE